MLHLPRKCVRREHVDAFPGAPAHAAIAVGRVARIDDAALVPPPFPCTLPVHSRAASQRVVRIGAAGTNLVPVELDGTRAVHHRAHTQVVVGCCYGLLQIRATQPSIGAEIRTVKTCAFAHPVTLVAHGPRLRTEPSRGATAPFGSVSIHPTLLARK